MARLRVLFLLCALAPAARAAAPPVAANPTAAQPVVATHAAASRAAPELERKVRVLLSVTSRTEAVDHIKNAASDLGGHLVQASGSVVTVVVPAGSYRQLLARLASLGDQQDVRVATTDLTDRIAAANARLRAARESKKRLAGVQGVARGIPDHLELERAQEDAESVENDALDQLESLEQSARQTRIEIRLAAPTIAPVPRPRLPFPWLGKLGLPRLLDTTAPHKPRYRLKQLVDGDIFLQGGYTAEADKLGGARALGALGLSFRMMGDADPIALYGGFDASLGGSKGFLYGLQMMIGAAVPIGRRVAFGVGSGPGIDGITSTIPFGVSFPIEAYLSLDLFKSMAATVQVHDGWVLAAKARRHGAPAAFGDEASARITLAFGKRHGGSYSQNREGPTFGFAVRQTMGATLYLVELGFRAHESNFTRSN